MIFSWKTDVTGVGVVNGGKVYSEGVSSVRCDVCLLDGNF